MTRNASAMRLVRHRRMRRRISGTPQRPRLCVFRSLTHIYAQVVDDSQGHTLVAASSLDTEVQEQRRGQPKTEVSKLVGHLLARRAQEQGIAQVVFDRGGYKYHGRVKALADAAREGGLIF
ncbi:MAG: 50S ribosomal protein L18 [Dehalococcoidia bacterium]